MMNKIYYIDTENVKTEDWISILDYYDNRTDPDEKYTLVLFYTDNSNPIPIRHLKRLRETDLELIEIFCVKGPNALDFQLVYELGRRSGQNEASNFIISGDHGYDAAISFASKYYHCNIKRYAKVFSYKERNAAARLQKNELQPGEDAACESPEITANASEETEEPAVFDSIPEAAVIGETAEIAAADEASETETDAACIASEENFARDAAEAEAAKSPETAMTEATDGSNADTDEFISAETGASTDIPVEITAVEPISAETSAPEINTAGMKTTDASDDFSSMDSSDEPAAEELLFGVSRQAVDVIVNCIGIGQKASLGAVLTRAFGKDKEQELYHFIKSEDYIEKVMDWSDPAEVTRAFIRAVLSGCQPLPEEDVEIIYQIYASSRSLKPSKRKSYLKEEMAKAFSFDDYYEIIRWMIGYMDKF